MYEGKNDYDTRYERDRKGSIIILIAPKRGNDSLHFARRSAQGAADWRSGPRWSILSVLCPVHPFPLRGTSPQGETRDMERKTGESYTSCTIPVFPPLVAAPPPFPRKRGHYKAPRSHVLISRSTLSTECSAPACGGCPAQPERGANAVSHSAESSSCHMTLKVNPVTLTL